jgi:hypothetical protein
MFNIYIVFFFKNILSLFFKNQRKLINFYFNSNKNNDLKLFDIYAFFRKILINRYSKNRNAFFYVDLNKINNNYNWNGKTSVFKDIPVCFVYNFRKPLLNYSLNNRYSFLVIKSILTDLKNIPFMVDNYPDTNLNSNYFNFKERTDIFYPFLRFSQKDNWFYFIIFFYFFFEFFIILFSVYFFFGSISDLFIFIKNNFIIISPFSLLHITNHKILTFIFFCSFFLLLYNIIEFIFQPEDIDNTFTNFSISKKNIYFFSFLIGFLYDIFYIIPIVFLWIFFIFSFLSFFLISFRFFLFPFLFFPFLFLNKIIFFFKNFLFYENYWINYNQTFFQKIKNYFSKLDRNFFYDNKDYYGIFLDKKFLSKNFSKTNFNKRKLRNYPLRLNINNIFLWNFLPNKTKKNNFKKIYSFDNINFNFLESRDKQLFPRFRSYKIKNPLLNNYVLYRKLYLLLKKKNGLLKKKKNKRRSYFFRKKNSYVFSTKFPINKSFLRGTLSFKKSKFFKKHKKEDFFLLKREQNNKDNNENIYENIFEENYYEKEKNFKFISKKYLKDNNKSISDILNKGDNIIFENDHYYYYIKNHINKYFDSNFLKNNDINFKDNLNFEDKLKLFEDNLKFEDNNKKLNFYFENYFNILLKKLFLNKKKYFEYNLNKIPYLKKKSKNIKNIDISEKLDEIFNLNDSNNRQVFIKYYTTPSIFEKKRRIIKQNYRKFLSNLMLFKYYYPSNKIYYPLFVNFSNFINNFKIEMLNDGLNSRLNSKNLLLEKDRSENLFKLNRRLIYNLKRFWEERNDKISKKKKNPLNLLNWKSILQRTSYDQKYFSEFDNNVFRKNKYTKRFLFFKTILNKNKNLLNYFKDYNNFLKIKRKFFLLTEKEKYIEENEKKFDKFLFLKNYKDFLLYFNAYKNRHFFFHYQNDQSKEDLEYNFNFLKNNYFSPFINLYLNKNFVKIYGNKYDNSKFFKLKDNLFPDYFDSKKKKKNFPKIKNIKTGKIKISKEKKKRIKRKRVKRKMLIKKKIYLNRFFFNKNVNKKNNLFLYKKGYFSSIFSLYKKFILMRKKYNFFFNKKNSIIKINKVLKKKLFLEREKKKKLFKFFNKYKIKHLTNNYNTQVPLYLNDSITSLKIIKSIISFLFKREKGNTINFLLNKGKNKNFKKNFTYLNSHFRQYFLDKTIPLINLKSNKILLLNNIFLNNLLKKKKKNKSLNFIFLFNKKNQIIKRFIKNNERLTQSTDGTLKIVKKPHTSLKKLKLRKQIKKLKKKLRKKIKNRKKKIFSFFSQQGHSLERLPEKEKKKVLSMVYKGLYFRGKKKRFSFLNKQKSNSNITPIFNYLKDTSLNSYTFNKYFKLKIIIMRYLYRNRKNNLKNKIFNTITKKFFKDFFFSEFNKKMNNKKKIKLKENFNSIFKRRRNFKEFFIFLLKQHKLFMRKKKEKKKI